MPDEKQGEIDWEVTLDREAITRAMTRRPRKRKDQNNNNVAGFTPGDIGPARETG
jgi:hypothetical protein